MKDQDKDLENQFIDVLLPICNSNEDYLIKSLESVLNQNIKTRLICILNGMTNIENEHYINLLNKYKCMILICPKKGVANALNFAIPFTKSTYIARQDDDDISHPKRLLMQKNYLDQNHCDVLGTNIFLIDKFDKVTGKRKYPKNDLQCKKQLIYKTCFCHPSVMMKREFLLKNNYPNLSSEDYALWIKGCKDNVYQNLNHELYYYRKHGKQCTVKNEITYLYIKPSIKLIKNYSNNLFGRTLNITKLLFYIFFYILKSRKIDMKTNI